MSLFWSDYLLEQDYYKRKSFSQNLLLKFTLLISWLRLSKVYYYLLLVSWLKANKFLTIIYCFPGRKLLSLSLLIILVFEDWFFLILILLYTILYKYFLFCIKVTSINLIPVSDSEFEIPEPPTPTLAILISTNSCIVRVKYRWKEWSLVASSTGSAHIVILSWYLLISTLSDISDIISRIIIITTR